MNPWLSNPIVRTSIGNMQVEFKMFAGGLPTEAMLRLGSELAEYAKQNTDDILDLIHAHYQYAEAEGWLEFWDVPGGLNRAQVMSEVDSMALVVDSDLAARVFVNPSWDPEHKLDLRFDGKITAVNDQPYDLVDGVLVLR